MIVLSATYEPIATTTVTSTTVASVTIDNIPTTYTDLVIVCSVKITAGGFAIRPNNNSSISYSGTYLRGNGTTATSTRLTTTDLGGTGWYIPNGSVSTTEFTPVIVNANNYSNTTTNKTALIRFSNSGNLVGAAVCLAPTTSAITSFHFSCDGGGNISQNSVFTLYGVKAG